MKKNEVKIGCVYTAKVTNKLVQVRIEAESRYGGWDAINLATGKKVRIKSPAKLRSAVGGDTLATGAKKGRATKNTKPAPEADTAQTSTPTVEDVAIEPSDEADAVQGPPPAAQERKDEEEATTVNAEICKLAPNKKSKKGKAKKQSPQDGKKPKKKAKADKPKRISGLDAAAMVLQESSQPMTCKEMVEAAEAQGYWKSPGGRTPHQTIASAIIREIATKASEARFRKAERGKFAHA